MAISENIKRLRLQKDWTQEQLAEKVDVTRSTVTQWETGWSQPRMGKVERLAAAFGISVAELVGGSSPLPRGAIVPGESRPAYAPLLGRVHAGDAGEPDILDERVSLPYEVRERHPDAYFLEVEGDCMDKVYPEGCYILVDPGTEPQDGSIAAVAIDGADYVMRRLHRGASSIMLSPESTNPAHEDIVVSSTDGRTVELVGTVVWFQAREEME